MRRHQPDNRGSSEQVRGQPAAWSRDKLLALLAGSALAALLLTAGLVLAVVSMLRPDGGTSHRAGAKRTTGAAGDDATAPPRVNVRAVAADDPDELAAAPMPSVPASASHPSAVSLAVPPAPLLLPAPTATGAAGVPTGFPRTSEGAVAQLAAIDASALSSASMSQARAVITGWALPGGPTASSWSGVRAVATLLDATATSGGTSGQIAVAASPLMGLVKGSLPRNSVEPDFVVACVDLELDVTMTATARGAVGDCQRMVWAAGPGTGRWLIGPGAEPAAAPSVWPGTDLAYRVGYRDLRYTAATGRGTTTRTTASTTTSRAARRTVSGRSRVLAGAPSAVGGVGGGGRG